MGFEYSSCSAITAGRPVPPPRKHFNRANAVDDGDFKDPPPPVPVDTSAAAAARSTKMTSLVKNIKQQRNFSRFICPPKSPPTNNYHNWSSCRFSNFAVVMNKHTKHTKTHAFFFLSVSHIK